MSKAPVKRKDPPVFHRLTIDVEPDLYRLLKAEAQRNERSVSKQAKVLLKGVLEENE